MTRFLFPVLASAALIVTPVLQAQDVDAEDVRNMKARLENLTEANDALNRQIQSLREEMSRLKGDQVRLKSDMGVVGKDNVTQDQLKKVVEQLREVDKKRETDSKALLERMEEVKTELKKFAAAAAAVPAPQPESTKPQGGHKTKPKPAPQTDAEAKSDTTKAAAATAVLPTATKSSLPAEYDYVEHVVASGETVGTIISAYNKEKGLKIKMQQVLDANPKLKPARLQVGQKIKIPLIK